MIKKTHLLLIDPQRDFCYAGKSVPIGQEDDLYYKENPDHKGGSLFVPGSPEDMDNVGSMIQRMKEKLSRLHITLDSHHEFDVGHSIFWKNSKGENPPSFTIINSQDIKDGNWLPYYPSLTKRMINYTEALEAGGRYPLCIWPTHCVIGTTGATIVQAITDAVKSWVTVTHKTVNFVAKGSNPLTEHYSGVKAEVVDPNDPSTGINIPLIQTLEEADQILLAGEAKSHCLANTARDIADNFSNTDYIKKFVLLIDGTSSVPGFEQLGEDFVTEMTTKGMQVAKTTDF
jgi:nicotinamidase-related amidase